MGGQTVKERAHEPWWTRDLPWWNWRYWIGKRWRSYSARYYNGVDRTHYRTDKEYAAEALAQQFDPDHWIHNGNGTQTQGVQGGGVLPNGKLKL